MTEYKRNIEYKKLKVLIVSAEVAPYAKTGGLGDIIGNLPKELRNQDVDARVVLPKYKCINEERYNNLSYINSLNVNLGSNSREADIFLLDEKQQIYTIGNNYFFNRADLYGYDDDFARFAFFTRASIEFLRIIDFKPDIIHFNDWQVGLGSFYLKEIYSRQKFYDGIKSLYAIHNIQYQGNFGRDILGIIGIPGYYYNSDSLEFYNNVSYMKAGILYSDAVSTVSENYAEEIQTSSYGYGLEGVISSRKKDLYGIVNGIEYSDVGNEICKDKKYLQKKLNLEVKDVPIISVVSRFAEQKGIDLILLALDEILSKDLQVVILGTGERKYEDLFKEYANRYPKNLSANILFDSELSKDIYKNSDIFLMPSLFEPCGLSQMIAMKYGTVPVVRKTGGLADTVKHYDSNATSNGTSIIKNGNGFVFEDYDAKGMMWALNEALRVYESKEDWNTVVNNAFKTEFSLKLTSKKYIDLYTKIKDN